MDFPALRKYMLPVLSFLILCLAGKFVLGLIYPFLLGYLLARAADPAVQRVSRKLPRWLSAGVGVTLTLVFIFGILSLLGAAAIRELTRMAQAMPDIRQTARQGMLLLQDFLIRLSNHTPEGIRPLLVQTVLRFFSDSSAMLENAVGQIPAMIGAFLTALPDRALSLGTGILAGFLISARLPELRAKARSVIPEKWQTFCRPALQKIRSSLGLWLKAQGKLAAITFCIVCIGLLLLGVSHAPVIAAAVALVDAVPMLGTGTVLIPWAVVELLQSHWVQALGLAGIYAAAMISRSVLEPRMLGRHLGLDPLVTLLFLYLGWRLWGFWGLLFFPMLAGAVHSVFL